MKKFTLSAIVVLVVVISISVASLVLINHVKLLAWFGEQEQLCYNFGLELTNYMVENQTLTVTGCECHFVPVPYRETVTDCVCDCLVPGIPLEGCNSVQGCFVRDLQCYCSFGIFTQ